MGFWKQRRIHKTFIEKVYGEKVVLYEDRYLELRDGSNRHTNHPEIESHLHILERALIDPIRVNDDKDGNGKMCYYADFGDDPMYKGKYMKVVVGRNKHGILEVITAHARENYLQNGETKVWPI